MTNRIVGALEHAATKLGTTLGEDAGKAVKDLYHSTGHNLKGIAEDTAAADLKHQTALRNLMHDSKQPSVHAPHAVDDTGHLPHEGGPSAARRQVEQDPHGNTRPGNSVSGCGDPVDVATGRMFLTQRDIVLPGALPLVFVRRTDSGYGAGRWFGASWSSTVDQRLEVDDQGVIFLHEAGLLLSYPFPVPGEPVLPVQGPRWPLTLEPDGTYTVRDSDGHRSWTFARPESGIARLTTIGDRNGHRITFEYDEQGTPAGVVHDGGYEIKVSTRDGRVAALHLAGAGSGGTDLEIVRYGYDGAG